MNRIIFGNVSGDFSFCGSAMAQSGSKTPSQIRADGRKENRNYIFGIRFR